MRLSLRETSHILFQPAWDLGSHSLGSLSRVSHRKASSLLVQGSRNLTLNAGCPQACRGLGVAFPSCIHLSGWATPDPLVKSPHFTDEFAPLCLCSEISGDGCVTFDFCHRVPVVRGDSRPSCPRFPLKKCTRKLGWTSTFSHPHLTLQKCFK